MHNKFVPGSVMGKKFRFRQLRIRENMWWTRYRFENPWAIGRLVIWSGRRGATRTNEIPGANFARHVLTRSHPIQRPFLHRSIQLLFWMEFLMNSAWNFEEFLRNSWGPNNYVSRMYAKNSNLLRKFLFFSRILIFFKNSYFFQEFLFFSRILIFFKNSYLFQ